VREAAQHTGLCLDEVAVLEADVFDTEALEALVKQTKVVINCVGPYVQWGEPVVAACVKNGASHVDISGEPLFQTEMALKYEDAARAKGVHVVSACGYDSVPAEMGVLLLNQSFDGGAASVEMFNAMKESKEGPRYCINTGTMDSALGIGAARARHTELDKQLQERLPSQTPEPVFTPTPLGLFNYSPILDKYGVPFPCDTPVVQRTQALRYHERGIEPVSFAQYLPVASKLEFVGTALGLFFFFCMGLWRVTAALVKKYPSVLSAGHFRRGGPPREALGSMRMASVLVGRGWSKAARRGSPPDQTRTLTIEGPDPGYVGTSMLLVGCAVTLLRDRASLSRPGVVTPGFAFERTRLVERLKERGISFTVREL